jgi:hypothetical protein
MAVEGNSYFKSKKQGDASSVMDPQLDVNVLIRVLRMEQEFIDYVRANRACGLRYNLGAKDEFLATALGSQAELDCLYQQYGIELLAEVSIVDLDVTAVLLRSAFDGDVFGRTLHEPDSRILSTGWILKETITTADLHLYKRARDLGMDVSFLGSGRAFNLAMNYQPRLVIIPNMP